MNKENHFDNNTIKYKEDNLDKYDTVLHVYNYFPFTRTIYLSLQAVAYTQHAINCKILRHNVWFKLAFVKLN